MLKTGTLFCLCHLVIFSYVYPGLGLDSMQDLRVEEAHNWLDKPSEERNLTKDKSGRLIFYAHPKEHWKGRYGPRDCVTEKGILPCVGVYVLWIPR